MTQVQQHEDQVLYLMKNAFGLYKIGISCSPDNRRRQIQNASGVEVELISVFNTSEPAPYVETKIHRLLDSQRSHGEWFHFDSSDKAVKEITSLLSRVDRPAPLKPRKKGCLKQRSLEMVRNRMLRAMNLSAPRSEREKHLKQYVKAIFKAVSIVGFNRLYKYEFTGLLTDTQVENLRTVWAEQLKKH